VFIVDETRGELWTKSAKGATSTIRVPLGVGIVGSVIATRKTENIEDVYNDSRFNPEIDKKLNYRTKSVLATPVTDSEENIIAVIQAINKFGGPFTNDDQSLLELLSSHAAVSLKNSLVSMKSMAVQHKLSHVLATAYVLFRTTDKKTILLESQDKIKSLLSTELSKMFFVEEEELYDFSEDGIKQTYSNGYGVAGLVAKSKNELNIASLANDPYYNPIVDLNTSMPVVVLPVMHEENDEILAVIEVGNPRGVSGKSAHNRSKLDPIDREMLKHF
jgi:putative methionine-R-sulfoxide reductase with GAF domain